MISKGLNTGNQVLGLIASSRIDVSHGNKLGIRNGKQLFEQVLSARANSDHANPHAIIRSEHASRRTCQKGRTSCGVLDEFTPGVFDH